MNKGVGWHHQLRSNWFLIGLGAVVVGGILGHRQLAGLAALSWLQTAIVFVVMWMMAAPVPLELVSRTITRPWAGLLASVINMGFIPLLAMLVAPLLAVDLSGGLLIAAALPSTLASAAVWTRKAGGDDTVAIFVTLLTNLACVIITPLWLVFLLGVRVELNLTALVQSLAIMVMLPIALAQVMRTNRRFAAAAERSKPTLSVLCQIGILAMVLLGSTQMGARLATSHESGSVDLLQTGAVILAASGIHVTALACAWFLAGAVGIKRPQQIAVALSGSQKTLMVGLKLAIDCGVSILPLIVFHVAQLFIDAILAQQWSRAGRAKSEDLTDAVD